MGEQKSLLQKIVELFRFPRFSRPAAESETSHETDTADVTVEREPDTASEDAVKGTATADETASDAGDGAVTGVADGTPVEEIKGIGPTYAGRLEDAGIDTVEALASADVDHVAEVAQTSDTKASNWIERANES